MMLPPDESRRAGAALQSPLFAAPPASEDDLASPEAYAAWLDRCAAAYAPKDALSAAVKTLDREGGTLADLPPEMKKLLEQAEEAMRGEKPAPARLSLDAPEPPLFF